MTGMVIELEGVSVWDWRLESVSLSTKLGELLNKNGVIGVIPDSRSLVDIQICEE